MGLLLALSYCHHWSYNYPHDKITHEDNYNYQSAMRAIKRNDIRAFEIHSQALSVDFRRQLLIDLVHHYVSHCDDTNSIVYAMKGMDQLTKNHIRNAATGTVIAIAISSNCSVSYVRTLLDMGFQIDNEVSWTLGTHRDKTDLETAEASGRTDLVKLLVSRGATKPAQPKPPLTVATVPGSQRTPEQNTGRTEPTPKVSLCEKARKAYDVCEAGRLAASLLGRNVNCRKLADARDVACAVQQATDSVDQLIRPN